MDVHEQREVSPSGEVFIPTKLRGLPSKLVEEFLLHDALPVDVAKRESVLRQRKEIVAETQRREIKREEGKRKAFNDFYAGLEGDDKVLMDRAIALSGDRVGRFVRGEGDISSLLAEDSFLMSELREEFLYFQQKGAEGKFSPTLSDVDREVLTNFQYELALQEYRKAKELGSPDLKESRVVSHKEEDLSTKTRGTAEGGVLSPDLPQPKDQSKKIGEAEAMDWRKIPRASEVMAVGDLFGSVEALRANLESLGVVSVDAGGNLRWTGGDRKVVFHGDILGDRQTHGMDAVDMISKLSKEAKLQGGEIDILSGNHEDFFLSFLSGRIGAASSDAFESCRQGHYYGLLELCRYGSSQLSGVDLDAFTTLDAGQQERIWQQLNAERELVLRNMQGDSRGREMLETMCNFKLAVVHDDSLFTHTDPTFSMMETLTKQGDIKMMVDRINTYYQAGLRDVLLNNKEPSPFFDQLRDVFLNTDNREYFWRGLSGKDEFNFIDAIKKQGINAIFHGHTDQFLPVYERQDLSVASVDMGALRDEGHKNKRSVLKIKQNGVIERGRDLSSIRK